MEEIIRKYITEKITPKQYKMLEAMAKGSNESPDCKNCFFSKSNSNVYCGDIRSETDTHFDCRLPDILSQTILKMYPKSCIQR